MLVEDLRKKAELHLCDDCYREYESMLEPTIKDLILRPMQNWRAIELYLEILVMKCEGVFKDETIIIMSFGEKSNKSFEELFHKEDYRKIKFWNTKKKIDYLHDRKVIGEYTYRLLDRARKIRNRIHDAFDHYSEQDLELIDNTSKILENIFWSEYLYSNKKDILNLVCTNAEKHSRQLLEAYSDV
jgi:hypothetical protein